MSASHLRPQITKKAPAGLFDVFYCRVNQFRRCCRQKRRLFEVIRWHLKHKQDKDVPKVNIFCRPPFLSLVKFFEDSLVIGHWRPF